MIRLLGVLLFCLTAVIGVVQPSQAAEQLELAILPYLPGRAVLELYKPLRIYLENRLAMPVTLVTAPDVPTFMKRLHRREYSFVITSSHGARLAQLESGYVPLLRPNRDTHLLLLVRNNQKISSIADLRGKSVAFPDPLAFVSLLAMDLLKTAGLEPGKDFVPVSQNNHASAMHAVIAGEADAALVSDRAFVAAISSVKQQLKDITVPSMGFPGVVYMAKDSVPSARVEAVVSAITVFVNETPQGKQFMNALGYDTLRPVGREELASMDPYLPALRAQMKRLSDPQPPISR